MVDHAARRVPAYRDVLTPSDAAGILHLTDVAGLPIVDKAHFLGHAPADRAWAQSGLVPGREHSSSGTTGQAFTVPWSARALWRTWVQQLWTRWPMRVPALGLHVSVLQPARVGPQPRRGVHRALHSRRVLLPETRATADLAGRLRHLRPAWLTGQPHVLATLAEELDGDVRPRTVTTYGSFSDDLTRALLTDAFGTAPLDVYGAVETMQVAWQCRAADLYHVNHETVLAEVVDDGGRPLPPGETGHLVLTGLLNPLLPMIRYRIGDEAVWADRPCSCGERLPVLDRIYGRELDWLLDDRGQRVAPQRLWITYIAPEAITALRRYRLVPAADGRVTFEVVPARRFDPELEARVVTGYQRVLGPRTPVEVRAVDRIDVGPGERFRQFRSFRVPAGE